MPAEVLTRYMGLGLLWVAVAVDFGVHVEGGNNDGAEGHRRNYGEDEEVVGFLACFPIVRQDTNPTTVETASERTTASSAHLHIAELSVHVSHQRRGLGKRLLEAMFAETRKHPFVSPPPHFEDEEDAPDNPTEEGTAPSEAVKKARRIPLKGYTLTTYIHLSFNAPFYEKMGFRLIDPVDIEENVGRRAAELWEEEQRSIAIPEKRCWMMRALYP
ncbi:uncharacterized protein AB675_11387 [Cyphellophora attinorum]|uniref:N-acetyltransferase domain-containing protein n=1 Tax=Cyphellophora attinorum TaxID=1664694 RepID=A0A0N0NMB4_9EURO|nr:uncharacterized protein AB675_11387 [Phialophora attinorum]KPI40158.1 hypothetical protein AB675_11387 [Phialophora attinorum]